VAYHDVAKRAAIWTEETSSTGEGYSDDGPEASVAITGNVELETTVAVDKDSAKVPVPPTTLEGTVGNLSRAFCDPRPRSNQIMSAAQHLALINTIRIRARIMEINAN
jgi:hypothetical protein